MWRETSCTAVCNLSVHELRDHLEILLPGQESGQGGGGGGGARETWVDPTGAHDILVRTHLIHDMYVEPAKYELMVNSGLAI